MKALDINTDIWEDTAANYAQETAKYRRGEDLEARRGEEN